MTEHPYFSIIEENAEEISIALNVFSSIYKNSFPKLSSCLTSLSEKVQSFSKNISERASLKPVIKRQIDKTITEAAKSDEKLNYLVLELEKLEEYFLPYQEEHKNELFNNISPIGPEYYVSYLNTMAENLLVSMEKMREIDLRCVGWYEKMTTDVLLISRIVNIPILMALVKQKIVTTCEQIEPVIETSRYFKEKKELEIFKDNILKFG